jgi:hypothetical protein
VAWPECRTLALFREGQELLFNSSKFLVFLPVDFVLYSLLSGHCRKEGVSPNIVRLPAIGELVGILLSVAALCILWAFFCSHNIVHAVSYLSEIATAAPGASGESPSYAPALCVVAFIVAVDWAIFVSHRLRSSSTFSTAGATNEQR